MNKRFDASRHPSPFAPRQVGATPAERAQRLRKTLARYYEVRDKWPHLWTAQAQQMLDGLLAELA